MILVDEYAVLPALAGRPHLSLAGDVLVLTYSRAYRLTRALLDPGPGRLQTPAGSSFTYTYDFGDNWRHKVTVEKVTPADPSVTYPVCTGGRRARPPEDCGGVWGYVNVLAVLADPADEEHASMREWVGGAFDPEAFDPSEFADNLKVGSALEP